MITIDYTTSTYSDSSTDHASIEVTGEALNAALGYDAFEADQGDGPRIDESLKKATDLLIEAGAPAWVADATGVLEDGGHIWIGPSVEA